MGRTKHTSTHPQVRVEVGDYWCPIDVELAPLIRAAWHLGIGTWSCCQDIGESQLGEMGRAYIFFDSVEGLTVFMRAIYTGVSEDRQMVLRMRDHGVGGWHTRMTFTNEFDAVNGARLEFPRVDIPEMVRGIELVMEGFLARYETENA